MYRMQSLDKGAFWSGGCWMKTIRGPLMRIEYHNHTLFLVGCKGRVVGELWVWAIIL